jgi:DNA-binding ferritin-like protein
MIRLEALSQLVWELRYLSMAAQVAHWRVFGPTSYSDHLLYGRVYEKLNDMLDPLAEKLTALSQMEDRKYVCPLEQAKYVHLRMTDSMPRLQEALEDPNLTAAFFYNELLSLTRRMRSFASEIAHGEEMTFGLEDFLGDMSGDLETLVYFLERRAQVILSPSSGTQYPMV